ncbi:hypothetical protein vcoNHCC006C_003456A, partial [Vibrio cholerae O1 str. NHCC-006C]|jgi:hypothetical protein
MQLL